MNCGLLLKYTHGSVWKPISKIFPKANIYPGSAADNCDFFTKHTVPFATFMVEL
jgi:hypothetical protein